MVGVVLRTDAEDARTRSVAEAEAEDVTSGVRDVRERPITLIAVDQVQDVVGEKQVLEAVVVLDANSDPLREPGA